MRTAREKEVDRELIVKGKKAIKDFDMSKALHVPAKRKKRAIEVRRLQASLQTVWVATSNGDSIEVTTPIRVNHCPTCGKRLKRVRS